MTLDKSMRAWLFAALALCLVAFAIPQTALAADEDDEEAIVEEIVVTGSRVKRSDFNSSSPITVITGQSILESGFGDIGEALRNSVTAGTAGFNQSAILSGGGSTSIDLRNIGQSRVLVLINGKRVASFADSLANQAVDLTFIPNALIERVDILRDGASAVYGSDAISGVVNVILKERFEGVEAGVTTGISGEGDAERYSANVAIGATSDRGSIMMGGEYRYQNNLPQVDRDWAFPNITSLSATGFNNGSFFSPGGVFFGDGGGLYCTLPKAFGGDEVTNVGAAGCPSFQGQTDRNVPARYDYGLQQDIYSQSRVLSTAAYGVYEIFDGVEAFIETEYSKRRSEYNLDGNPGGFGTSAFPGGWRVPATNPNNMLGVNGGLGEAGSLFIRPSSTVGIRANTAEADTIRLVAGVRGDILVDDDSILDGWSYEVSWIYTRVDSDIRTNSVWNLARANRISDPDQCSIDPLCAAAVNPSGALDAYRPGNWTDSEIAYLRQNSISRSEFQTSGWFASMTGPVMELPAGEMQLAFGVETRTDEGFNKPDSVTEAGESIANQVFTTEGSLSVDEFFAELDIPVLADVPGFKQLDLNAQFRYSDYSAFGAEEVYRFGLNWQISDDVRVRASVSTAYRAPQVTDLFGGGTVSFDFFSHPCAAGNADRAAGNDVDINCNLDGIPNTAVQAAGQFAVLAGSNADLEPETADTTSIGIIFTPSFLDGFSLSIDYWDISVDDLISRPTSDSVVDDCYGGPVGLSAPECARFTSTQTLAGLGVLGLENALVNRDNVSTDGFDFNARYEFDSFAGTVWNVSLLGTYVKANSFYPGAGGADDRGSIPRIRANLNTTVDWQSWDFRWGVRYIHSMSDPRYDGNNLFGYKEVSSHTEHDMNIAYNFDKYRVVVGVNDVFDNDPPYVFSTGNNTDLNLYGAVGRFMFLRLQANL